MFRVHPQGRGRAQEPPLLAPSAHRRPCPPGKPAPKTDVGLSQRLLPEQRAGGCAGNGHRVGRAAPPGRQRRSRAKPPGGHQRPLLFRRRECAPAEAGTCPAYAPLLCLPQVLKGRETPPQLPFCPLAWGLGRGAPKATHLDVHPAHLGRTGPTGRQVALGPFSTRLEEHRPSGPPAPPSAPSRSAPQAGGDCLPSLGN